LYVRYKDIKSIHIFAGVPESYPLGFPVDGIEQIPILKKLTLDDVPEFLCPFDQLSRVKDMKETALHFFRDDVTFQEILGVPDKYVEKFSHYKAILTPDCSLTFGMSPSKRAHQTLLSRAAGAVWQSRGLKVIPTIRWCESSDYDLVCCGISQNSVIAISSYGSDRDPMLRKNFQDGARAIAERLNPVAILIYGSISEEFFRSMSKYAKIIHFPSSTSTQQSIIRTLGAQNDEVLF
jgi:hypothetical protein